MDIASRFVAVDGHRIATQVVGSGPDVLFLHGFPTSGLDWRPVIRHLATRFRCITLDFPGFGASDKPRIAYRYAMQVRAALATLEAHGVASAAIVAHDYGVSVAQELPARSHERTLHVLSWAWSALPQAQSASLTGVGRYPRLEAPDEVAAHLARALEVWT